MKSILIAIAALTTVSAAAFANDSIGYGDRPYNNYDQAPFEQSVKKNKFYTSAYQDVYSNSISQSSNSKARLLEKNGSADIPTN